MPLTGYLKIPDIAGESLRVDHEEEIDIFDIQWLIEQAAAPQVGRGRSRSRAQVGSLHFRKFYDASSPYLALACMQAKSFDEVVCTVRKDSGEAHLDYLTITMTNVIISSYDMIGIGELRGEEIEEKCGFACESIKIKYVIQADDHSAGDEHEIEYDMGAGA